MASAGWALQRAMYETLTADAAVTAILGGPRIHDDVPRAAELPYVTIGQSSTRDWSDSALPISTSCICATLRRETGVIGSMSRSSCWSAGRRAKRFQ